MKQHFARMLMMGLFVLAGALGCAQQHSGDNAPRANSIPSNPGDGGDAKPPMPPRALSFRDATTEECPDDQLLPPDRTLNGLSSGRIREEVQRLWDGVAFTSGSGRKLVYLAEIETDFGTLSMQMLPELAPNHVRNFVALTRAKYYDGLFFEHVIDSQGDGGPESRVEMVEAGCPLGTGEMGIGHLGYWLKPEIQPDVRHDEGMVGACLTGGSDTAACRFYITLSKAPVLDGNFTVFAKLTRGLDVLRTIARQPRPATSMRPNQPAMMRSVRILAEEMD